MGIFSRKKAQKPQKRIRRKQFSRRVASPKLPDNMRRAGDYFRSHPTAQMKAAA